MNLDVAAARQSAVIPTPADKRRSSKKPLLENVDEQHFETLAMKGAFLPIEWVSSMSSPLRQRVAAAEAPPRFMALMRVRSWTWKLSMNLQQPRVGTRSIRVPDFWPERWGRGGTRLYHVQGFNARIYQGVLFPGERGGVRKGVVFILFLCLVLWPHRLSAEDKTASFDAANKLYAEAKFVEAAGAYQEILETGHASSAIYFNLGNAFFKSGQMGRAIAAYRQAERITPRDPDLRANLQFARNQVQGPTLRPGRWERWLGTLSLNEWTCLGAGAIWLTFALLTVRQLWPPLARPLRNWTWLAGAAAGVLTVCAALAFSANSSGRTAIVVAPEAAVRNAPFDEAPSGFTARDGAELRVLDSKGDWLQVADGTRRVGWVKSEAVVSLTRS